MAYKHRVAVLMFLIASRLGGVTVGPDARGYVGVYQASCGPTFNFVDITGTGVNAHDAALVTSGLEDRTGNFGLIYSFNQAALTGGVTVLWTYPQGQAVPETRMAWLLVAGLVLLAIKIRR